MVIFVVFYAAMSVLSFYAQKAKIGWEARLNTEVAGELVSCAIS